MKSKIAEIKSLRKQGKTYDEIAGILKISSFTAHKYGKTVQVEEKRKEREELADKPVRYAELKEAVDELRKENKELREKEEEFKRIFGGMEGVKKRLNSVEKVLDEREAKIKRLINKLNAISVKLNVMEHILFCFMHLSNTFFCVCARRS